MLYQLSYEATDVGSRSIVGSYLPVKEMSVNDIWNKSYNYISTAEMKLNTVEDNPEKTLRKKLTATPFSYINDACLSPYNLRFS